MRLRLEPLEDRLQPAVITVTNALNSGPGSLRAAINAANATTAADAIRFSIPGMGVHRIELLSALPAIVSPLTIDGTSQPGWTSSVPKVVLNGSQAGPSASGLVLSAGNSTVQGLTINEFAIDGIRVRANNCGVFGCHIGTGAAGLSPLGNALAGIRVFQGSVNTAIGGNLPNQGNLITSNGVAGIVINGVGTSQTQVAGNLIGADISGASKLPNAVGIKISGGATGNTIGGTAGNIISGNTDAGVLLTAVSGNVLSSNTIGLTASGSATLGNAVGVMITDGATGNTIGGTSGNTISGNATAGVQLAGAPSNTISHNRIGTSPDGMAALPNGGDGISISSGSGTTSVTDNVVSGNWNVGISLTGSDVTNCSIDGNIIGLNASGTAILANAIGVRIADGASGNTIGGATGNTISGNLESGVSLTGAAGNTVSGNRIGTSSDGMTALANGGNGVWVQNGASSTVLSNNLISGNAANGVAMSGADVTNCTISGNIIGLKADGSAALPNTNGIALSDSATGNIIGGASGNTISGNLNSGILLTAAPGNTISGNRIGTDLAGGAARPNVGDGISILMGSGSTQVLNNQISGNTVNGVTITGSDVTGCVVSGNIIGLNATGTGALGNIGCGVFFMNGANHNQVGGTTDSERNIISENIVGVKLSDPGTSFNSIEGNFFGTDVTGTHALGNILDGVGFANGASNNTVGGTITGARNILSGNQSGVVMSDVGTSGNVTVGNYIGTDVTGTQAVGNTFIGVLIWNGASNNIVGGTSPGAGNVISGTSDPNSLGAGIGVLIDGPSSGNIVRGNLIGTDETGTFALGNQAGVTIGDGASGNIIGGTDPGARNIISGNFLGGVSIAAPGNIVLGNYIGTDVTGTAPLGNSGAGISLGGASDNVIGGTAPGAGNVISGNGTGLILTSAFANQIQGNFVGTDVTGSVDLGNGIGMAIEGGAHDNLIGGNTAGAGNIISGNGAGILIHQASNHNDIQGNFIGVSINGIAMGNDQWGVSMFRDASDNLIGGTGSGEGNVVANNGEAGVIIGSHSIYGPADSGNSVLGNSIFDNGGLGIDLGPYGSVTPNDTDDADTGPNDLLNFPVLNSAILAGSDLTISGSINTEQNKTLRIEFFANTSVDPSGYGEGQTFLGFVDVVMGANNTMNFSQSLSVAGVMPGQFITATATDELGNTSEFSLALAVS